MIQAWQSSPGVARLVVFIIVYFIVSAILRAILGRLPFVAIRLIPNVIGKNRLLGGTLGLVVGGARVIVISALLFVALQYITLPTVAAEANASAPYQYLKHNVFEPWLQPLLNRDLPVLEAGALEPLTKNIDLLAVPTNANGNEQGFLVVPKQVSALAKQIVKGDHTDEQKAYALYEWEIHHIRYDWKKYDDYVYHGQWDAQTPLQTLETGEGVCADYALLYADMAHSVGLTVDIVEGIGGTPTDNGAHAWNRVYDAQTKQWLNVDTTWGAEQDAWFNPPNFSATHATQRIIEIKAGGS